MPVNQTDVSGIYRPENKKVDQEEINALMVSVTSGNIPESLQLDIS